MASARRCSIICCAASASSIFTGLQGKDLYASERGYSLKDLEVFYTGKRDGEVATASDGIVAYERFLETGDQSILEEIERYNEVDCRSTKGLARLAASSVRPANATWFVTDSEARARSGHRPEAREALAQGAGKRAASVSATGSPGCCSISTRFIAAPTSPRGGNISIGSSQDSEELIDDLESLGGLVGHRAASRACPKIRLSETRDEAARERLGVCVRGLQKGSVTIVELDRRERQIAIKGTKKIGLLPDRTGSHSLGPAPKQRASRSGRPGHRRVNWRNGRVFGDQ